MELQKITNKLQDLCHEGHSQDKIRIKILDAYYKIGGIKKIETDGKITFVVEAEV